RIDRRCAPPRPRYRRPGRARHLSALAPRRRVAVGGGDRRAQPAVLEHNRPGASGARSRSRDGQPTAAAEAPADATRHGPVGRPPPPRARRAAVATKMIPADPSRDTFKIEWQFLTV